MNVAELAKDLEVPPSMVLEACTGLGIHGAWAGAEVSSVDEVRLRLELSGDGRASGVPVDDRAIAASVLADSAVEAEAVPDGAAGPVRTATAGPPLPIDERGPVGTPDGSDGATRPPDGGGGPLAAPGRADLDPAGPVPTVVGGPRPLPTRFDQDRRPDPAIRPALIALGLAVVVAVGANQLENPGLILACWLLVGMFLTISVVSSNRARYRITTHPDRRSGLQVAVAALIAGLLGVAALGGAVWTVVRSAPASEAPVGLGDLGSVQRMRWGYQRISRIADTGWTRPAKDEGTCWTASEADRGRPRREERVEVGDDPVGCNKEHGFEVVQVIAVNEDADAAYPGVARLKAIGAQRCQAVLDDVAPTGAPRHYEHPTRAGWEDGDHDVACVVEAERVTPLIP